MQASRRHSGSFCCRRGKHESEGGNDEVLRNRDRGGHGVAAAVGVDVVDRAAAQVPDVPGWQLAWHDEFDGSGLNTTNWEALDRENSYNNEKQYYLPSQVTVADGNLQITATNQPFGSKQYRSGLITSQACTVPGGSRPASTCPQRKACGRHSG